MAKKILTARVKRKTENAHKRAVRLFDRHPEIVGMNWRKRIGPKSVNILNSKKCPGARITRKGFWGVTLLGIELHRASHYNLAARGLAKEITDFQNALWRQEAGDRRPKLR